MKILDEQKREISILTDLTAKKVKTSRGNVTNFLEEKTKFEEERAATDQHLRAYKRQVDNLRQQLDDKTSNDKTSNDYEAKVCNTDRMHPFRLCPNLFARYSDTL